MIPDELALASILARDLFEAIVDLDPERARYVAHYAAYGIAPDDILEILHPNGNHASEPDGDEELRAWLMGE